MAPPPRLTKAESAARTRQNLLDAAGKLYFERGYAETSLADIAAEAGVTKGAVYAHFASKDEMIVALLAQTKSSIVDLSMFGGEGTPGDQVRAFGRSIAEDYRDDRFTAAQSDYVSVAIRNPRAREVFGAMVVEALSELGASVDAAFSDEEPGPFSGTELVLIFDALIQGILIRRAINPELFTDDLIERSIALMFCAFVAGVVDPDEALAREEERKQRQTKRRG